MFNLEVLTRILLLVAGLVLLSALYWLLTQFVIKRAHNKKLSNPLIRLGILTLSISAAVATLFLGSFFYVYYGFGHQPDIYRSGNRTSKMVALTFDDGPSLEFTPAILNILKEHNAPATFFMVGSHVEKYPEIAQRIVEEGHEIGNHTQNHRNIPTLSTLDLHREVMEATRIITEVTGVYPQYIRPPRGMYDGRFRRLAHLVGHEIILWTTSSRDWRYGVTADSIVKNVTSRAKSGDIFLFHDSGALVANEGGDRRATVKALPQVIATLRAKGFEIVPLSVLLHGHEPTEVFPVVDMPE